MTMPLRDEQRAEYYENLAPSKWSPNKMEEDLSRLTLFLLAGYILTCSGSGSQIQKFSFFNLYV